MHTILARALIFALFLSACGDSSTEATPSPSAKASPAAKLAPTVGTVTLSISYGSEKDTWLKEMIGRFKAAGLKTKSGKAINIEAKGAGSGDAMQSILSGQSKPHVFSPASGAYI